MLNLKFYFIGINASKGFSSSIENLDLSHNSIHSVPKSLSKYLTNLLTLDLSFNPIESLKTESVQSIQELSGLRVLKLSNVGLEAIPDGFFSKFR